MRVKVLRQAVINRNVRQLEQLKLGILASNQLDAFFYVFIYFISLHGSIITVLIIRRSNCINTFTAIVDLSRFNNSCLKSPASTLVDLTFQSRALRSFSLNQLRNLSL